MEFVGRDEDASASFQQTGKCPANGIHETASRFDVAGQDAARPEKETQSVAHFRVFGVGILTILLANYRALALFIFFLNLIQIYSAFQFQMFQFLLEDEDGIGILSDAAQNQLT